MNIKPIFHSLCFGFICILCSVLLSTCKKSVALIQPPLQSKNNWSRSECLINKRHWEDCKIYPLTGGKASGTSANWYIASRLNPPLQIYLESSCDSISTEISIVLNNFHDTGTYILGPNHKGIYSKTEYHLPFYPHIYFTNDVCVGSVTVNKITNESNNFCYVSGKFNFDAVDSAGTDTVHIMEGKFSEIYTYKQ